MKGILQLYAEMHNISDLPLFETLNETVHINKIVLILSGFAS